MIKNYVLSYNPFGSNYSISQLFAFIKDNRNFLQYYTPFAGTYILKATVDLYTIQETLRGFFEESTFLVSEVTSDVAGGYLPSEVWTWLNSNNFPVLGKVN